MKERIKELAVAAGFAGDDYDAFESLFEQFATSIVKECLEIVEPDVGMHCGDEWYTTLKGAAQEIKEHFGIEK